MKKITLTLLICLSIILSSSVLESNVSAQSSPFDYFSCSSTSIINSYSLESDLSGNVTLIITGCLKTDSDNEINWGGFVDMVTMENISQSVEYSEEHVRVILTEDGDITFNTGTEESISSLNRFNNSSYETDTGNYTIRIPLSSRGYSELKIGSYNGTSGNEAFLDITNEANLAINRDGQPVGECGGKRLVIYDSSNTVEGDQQIWRVLGCFNRGTQRISFELTDGRLGEILINDDGQVSAAIEGLGNVSSNLNNRFISIGSFELKLILPEGSVVDEETIESEEVAMPVGNEKEEDKKSNDDKGLLDTADNRTPAEKCTETADASDADPKCVSCVERGGIWIAIGCVDPTPLGIMTRMVQTGLGVMGGVALFQLIVAGIHYQRGKEEEIAKARSKIIATLSGLALLVFSVTLLRTLGVNILDTVPAGLI